MPGVRGQGNNAGLVTPIRVDGVFDDPGEVRRLVERNAPYPTMASFLPDSAVRGRRAMAGEGVPPHFRATWAAAGRSRTGPRSSSATPACCARPRNCSAPR